MDTAKDLLKAHRVGIRELKEHISTKFLNGILIITDRGMPVSVNLPYSDMLELLDVFDELRDMETLLTIARGRSAIKRGAKGIPVSRLFSKMRARWK